MTSGNDIVLDAYHIANIVGDEQDPSGYQGAIGLKALNQILDQWSLMPLTVPVTAREVFPLEAGRGGPDDPYTIGPGGDFDTQRPTSITNVTILQDGSAGEFEIMRSLYTEDAYASIVQKGLPSTYAAGVWLEATSLNGRANLYLWPVPSDDTTSLVLYLPKHLRQFATLADQYDFPPGAVSALTFELAVWLAVRYARGQVPGLESLRDKALAVYQRNNTVMTDLGMDAALTSTAGVYNILSDAIQGVN